MPCVYTRLIALGKEKFAIFIPRDTVVQVKSTENTISVVFRWYVDVTLSVVSSAFV